MHKAASTFVADVLFNSLAERSGFYENYRLGSRLINFVQQQRKKHGLQPARSPAERREQLGQLFAHDPFPQTNGLISRIYPGHMPPVEKFLGKSLPDATNRIMIMRRDPRDAMVSLYYSMSYSHNPEGIEGDNTGFLRNRQKLRQQDVCEGIKTLLRTRGIDSTIPEFVYCTNMILDHDDVVDLPYELLVNEPHTWLVKFVDEAGMQDFVDEQWIDEMASHLRPPEVEDPNSHKRRMKPGNWSDVFDDELKQMVIDKLGRRLEKFGYHW